MSREVLINEEYIKKMVDVPHFIPCLYCAHFDHVSTWRKRYSICLIDIKDHRKRAERLGRCPLGKFLLNREEYVILDGRLYSRYSFTLFALGHPAFTPLSTEPSEEKKKRREMARKRIEERRERILQRMGEKQV